MSARSAVASRLSWARPTSCLPACAALACSTCQALRRRPGWTLRGLPAELHVAFRPERLRLTPGAEVGVNSVAGTVTETAYRGIVVDYRVRVGQGADLLSASRWGMALAPHCRQVRPCSCPGRRMPASRCHRDPLVRSRPGLGMAVAVRRSAGPHRRGTLVLPGCGERAALRSARHVGGLASDPASARRQLRRPGRGRHLPACHVAEPARRRPSRPSCVC